MYKEEVGVFKGRTDDCPKVSVNKAQIMSYMSNLDSKIQGINKMVSEKAEMLEKKPVIKAFVGKYLESLNKSKTFAEQSQMTQTESEDKQMIL